MPDDPVRISDLGALDELRPTDLVEVERVFPDGSRVSGRVSGAQVAGVAAPMPQERLLGRLADTGTGAPVPLTPLEARNLLEAAARDIVDDALGRLALLDEWSAGLVDGVRPFNALTVDGNARVDGDLTVGGVVLDPAAIAAAQDTAEAARDAALGAQQAAEGAADILTSATFANRLMVDLLSELPAASGVDTGVVAEVTGDGASTGLWQVKVVASVKTWVKVSAATTSGNRAAIEAEVVTRAADDAFTRRVLAAVEQVLFDMGLQPLGPNSLGAKFMLLGRNNASEFAVGRNWMNLGPYEMEVSEGNSLGLLRGHYNEDGIVIEGATRWGGYYANGVLYEQLGPNDLNLVWCADVLGPNNEVALGIAVEDGDFVLVGSLAEGLGGGGGEPDPVELPPDPGYLVWADAGNIWGLAGETVVQLTDTGDDDLPRIGTDGATVFFRRETFSGPRGFKVPFDDPDDFEVVYQTNNALEAEPLWGQSNAGGVDDAITTTDVDADNALMIAGGPVGGADEVLGTNLVPLRENDTETMSSGYAKKRLDLKTPARPFVLMGQSRGARSYAALKKGGSSGVFEKIKAQLTTLAARPGGVHVRTFRVDHGQEDGQIGTSGYDLLMRELLDDVNTDYRAITGQQDRIIMLMSQISSAAAYKTPANRDQFKTPFAQLKASIDYGDIFLVCPQYFFTYIDGPHLDAASERLLGEYHAKVAHRVVVKGENWTGLRPKFPFTLVGNDIVIDWHVPVGEVTFDTTLVSDPGDLGFNFLNGGSVSINNIGKTGPAQIAISMSGMSGGVLPTGSRLSFAHHNGQTGADPQLPSGPINGNRGCIRDQDDELSAFTGQPMRNWGFSFEQTF